MKLPVVMLMMLFTGIVHADAKSDAFNAGASYGKGSASQGTSALKTPSGVSSAIPGYTANPPEKGYYGGVTGGDGGLSDKGQAALGNSAAGQAVVDSSTKNPMPAIDPKAPFITIGKDAEAGSGGVMDGSNPQCTQTTVSKSTFENFTCERDVWLEQTCSRDAQPSGGMSAPVQTTSTIQVTGVTDGTRFSFTVPQTVNVTSAWITFTGASATINQMEMKGGFLGNSFKIKADTPFAANLVGPVTAGMVLTSDSFCTQNCNAVTKALTEGVLKDTTITLFLEVVTWEQHFEPSVSWSESCAVDKNHADLTASVCTSPGGYRTINNNGTDYQVWSDCWGYTDTWFTYPASPGNCGSLESNPACTLNRTTCTQQTGAYCEHETVNFECQTVHSSTGLVCGGEYICQSGECDATNGAGDSGFDTAVAKLAGLASAAEDVKNQQDQINVRAFSGQAMSCRKAFAGFNNCCKDSGWGADAGLAACNSDEMAIGKAKAKKVTVSVGERCDHQVLGVCTQKSKVYCVFTGKLARIIQEQGRRDQLHVSFGSGGNPDCRGITVPELQAINFDLINFADFYEDLMKNQKIPDTSAMTKLAKDRVAAQVNQMGGTNK